MKSEQAILSLAALAQPTRLDAYRLLVRAEPDGLAAGDLAERLAVPANTLSSHLNILARAGLVHGERHSRTIVYRADIARLRRLMTFLARDCCNGHPELCGPLVEAIRPCCPPAKEPTRG